MNRRLWLLVSREPVLLGALVTAVGDAGIYAADWSAAAQAKAAAVLLALVAWGVRMLSTPAERARQREVEAANAGHVEGYHQAQDDLTTLDPQKLDPIPTRARKR